MVLRRLRCGTPATVLAERATPPPGRGFLRRPGLLLPAGLRNFGTPPWPTIIILPAIGLPIGLVLVIALIIVSGLRRGREARDARK